MAKKLRVKKWIRSGELEENKTQDDILDECGNLLDSACTHEILGEVLFLATNGKYYTITVEAVIGEASASWRNEILKEEKEQKDNDNESSTYERYSYDPYD